MSVKRTKLDFGWGSAPPEALAGFKRSSTVLLRGRMEGEREGRRKERREGEGRKASKGRTRGRD